MPTSVPFLTVLKMSNTRCPRHCIPNRHHCGALLVIIRCARILLRRSRNPNHFRRFRARITMRGLSLRRRVRFPLRMIIRDWNFRWGRGGGRCWCGGRRCWRGGWGTPLRTSMRLATINLRRRNTPRARRSRRALNCVAETRPRKCGLCTRIFAFAEPSLGRCRSRPGSARAPYTRSAFRLFRRRSQIPL